MILVVAGWGIRYVIIGELHEVVCRRLSISSCWSLVFNCEGSRAYLVACVRVEGHCSDFVLAMLDANCLVYYLKVLKILLVLVRCIISIMCRLDFKCGRKSEL